MVKEKRERKRRGEAGGNKSRRRRGERKPGEGARQIPQMRMKWKFWLGGFFLVQALRPDVWGQLEGYGCKCSDILDIDMVLNTRNFDEQLIFLMYCNSMNVFRDKLNLIHI